MSHGLPLVLFFALFAVPSMALAVLAARAFHLRSQAAPGAGARRAGLLLLAAGALPLAMVVLTALLTAGAPLATQGGYVFLGYGAACAAIGAAGAWLQRRADGAPTRRLVKAAETAPFLVVMLDLVLLANAAAQLG